MKLITEPLLFQGRNNNNKYFEGWYFKHVSSDLSNSISIIPGIARDTHNAHAFIQTIIHSNIDNEPKLETHYHTFPMNDFSYSDKPFALKIEKNIFKRDEINIDLSDDVYVLKGIISFSEFTRIKTTAMSPNIMGYYAYLPFMECNHGIISMNHNLNGSLKLNNKVIDFNSGNGYIEKDWGKSFPKKYIWIQCNNFEGSDASIMCSIADIPFLGICFQGFICNFTIDGKEYRFATYNSSKLNKLFYSENSLNIEIIKANLRLEIRAKAFEGGTLKSPKNGSMSNTIKEGVCGIIDLKLIKENNIILFEGTGYSCGIEIVK